MEGRANRSLQLGLGGERQNEPSGGWFPPQCPSGELELNNFIRKANDCRKRARVVVDHFSNLKLVRSPRVSVGEPLKHVITIRGQILVSRTDDDPPPATPCVHLKRARVCPSKTSPCVPAPRAHVFQHVRVVPAYTEWTHGVFTPHTHHNTTTQHKTQHHNTTTTSHGDRKRQRQRETEREQKTAEERQEKRRQKKTKQDKTGEDKTRQEKREEGR